MPMTTRSSLNPTIALRHNWTMVTNPPPLENLLLDSLILLAAAVVAVPLFRRFGLGSVLGYLCAGVVIGPDVLALIADPGATHTLSEFGVVMLLFIIGLELSPARLWVMRRQVFGFGGLQVILSTALLAGAALFWLDEWRSTLIVSLGLALSSTAVGLQLLSERKQITSAHGRQAFAILLFQDLIAIPLLAVIPLLASGAADAPRDELVQRALATIGVIGLIVIGGRFFLRPMFRAVAKAQSVEVFSASALLVVLGAAWLVQSVGLSMGLGAFLAGVLLAESEFRHELESHIEPFKGLLLGLFFMSVGMYVDLDVIVALPWTVLAGILLLLSMKAAVLYVTGAVADLAHDGRLQLVGLLSMGGEFAFVVFAEASRVQLLSATQRDVLVVVVGVSMALTPLLLMWIDRSQTRALPVSPHLDEPALAATEQPRVIIAGFGRVGQVVARLLRAQGIPFTALENDPEQLALARRFGAQLYFGDPSRPDLLRAAHIERAEVFVLATDDPDVNVRTARMVKRLFPNVRVLARARNRRHAFRLMDLSVDGVVRENFPGGLELSRAVMLALGVDRHLVDERISLFRDHDEALLREQHLIWDDEAALVQSSISAERELARLFQSHRAKSDDPEPGSPSET